MKYIHKLSVRLFLLSLLTICSVSFFSCSDSKDDPDIPPGEFYIKPEKSEIDLGRLSSNQEISIETNITDITIKVLESGKDWCTASLSNNKLTISAKTNTGNGIRKTMVNLSGEKVSKNIIISQKGLGSSSGSVADDILLPAISASTNSEEDKEEIEKSLDGNFETIYHSKWDGSVDFPIELIYNFQDISSMDYIIYHPRQEGTNGNFKELEVWYATETSPLQKYGDFDFKGSSVASRITFTPAIEKPTQIKFVVKSGEGDNGKGYASCAEMEFYRVNPDSFDYTTIFADAACTSIKSNLTRSDLEKISNVFFKELALEIFDKKYDSEFRIQEYKVYQHPSVMAGKNKTNPYSLRDNPTGIYVKQDEELIVFADDLKGQNVSLLAQDLTYGFGGTSYPLVKGQNKFKINGTGGLLYVMYHTTNATESPVKLHIATGTVNGYFDSQKHNQNDWSRLLNAASFKDFDVLGKYAHLTFTTDKFRAKTPDGKALIDVYDKIVELQWDFMGLFKYNKTFKNRMYYHVVGGDSYMYATDYRTAYHQNTLDELCDANLLATTAIWGPAHEVGHCNQTRPGLKWIGMTEVTNNIYSLYVQTALGNTSRIMDGAYEKAVKAIVDTNVAHNSDIDVFYKLVPFWQLKLYMHDALGKTDFYKDLFEKIRVSPNPQNEGLCQLQFVRFACEAANLDLTEFFHQWGFLTPINRMIDDYAKAQFTITQSQIEQLKAEIAAKNYPKPKHNNIYLIKDDNVNNYK